MALHSERLRNFDIDGVLRNCSENFSSFSPHEAKRLTLDRILIDIRTYWEEYLYRFPTLPFNLELRFNEREEKFMFYAPEYGKHGYWLKVDPRERNGGINSALEKIVTFMRDAPDGSIAFFTSPPGPTGMPEMAVHTESQTFVYQKYHNQIKAFSFITDLSLLESERLVQKHSDFIPDLNQTLEARLHDVVSQPVFLSPKKGRAPSVHEILDMIQSEMGTKLARENVPFSSLHYYVNHPETISAVWQDSTRIQNKIEAFRNLINSLPADATVTKNAIAQNIYLLIVEISASTRNIPPEQVIYSTEFAYVNAQTGCNGGGLPKTESVSNGETRYAGFVKNCPYCGQSINREMQPEEKCPGCPERFPGFMCPQNSSAVTSTTLIEDVPQVKPTVAARELIKQDLITQPEIKVKKYPRDIIIDLFFPWMAESEVQS